MARFDSKSGYDRRLILASGSPRRQELMTRLDCSFTVLVADLDESSVMGAAPELVAKLALQKAQAVCDKDGSERCVLGADTVVALSQQDPAGLLGKPRDQEDARAMLRRLSGRTHWVYTGVAVCRNDAAPCVDVSMTEVTFRSLSESEITSYVASGEPKGKAGAYAIQGAGRGLVDSIHGCFYNVVGLPLNLTARLLGDLVGPAALLCDCAALELQRGDPRCDVGITSNQ